MRRIYNSKTLTAWLAVFCTFELGFVYLLVTQLASHHVRTAVGVIALNVLFASLVLLMFRDLEKVFGFRYETDGATWIRRFGQGVEQRITKDAVTAVRRDGLEIVLVSGDQELRITRDSWGYDNLRDIAEDWAKVLDGKTPTPQ